MLDLQVNGRVFWSLSMAKSSAARTEARLKQLCCLGLGREAVIPAVLAELRGLIPNQSSLAFFLDRKLALAGSYCDSLDGDRSRSLYMTEFHGRRDRELGGAFPDNVRTQLGVQDQADALGAINVNMSTFARSDFYNLIYRPTRTHWFMRLMVRERGNGRALGCLTLYREAQDRKWSPQDKRRLAGLESFFAQALRTESSTVGPLADSGKSGLIIADKTGKPVHLSKEGRHLLYLATHPYLTPSTNFDRLGMLPTALVRICRDIDRIFSDNPVPSAPVYYHRNIWGGFRFEAQWLNASDPGSGFIGITVSHEEPTGLRMARSVAKLQLTARQAQVCLLMADGHSYATIADRIGIAKHTAIAHGRWVYNNLDVHSRTELVSKLLALG
jgi:DNA-binding CsgD family transcriptional regulator